MVVRWLALDIGSRCVGAAVCDEDERVVTPISSLPHSGPTALVAAIARLVFERSIGGVVVGVPRTRSGQSPGERRVASVVASLREQLTVRVELVDERGTTLEAQERLQAAGVPRKDWPRVVDGVAAQVILESHLEQHGTSRQRQGVDRCGNEC